VFTLGHATLLILGTFLVWWLWRVLGQRDRALAIVRRHCKQHDLQLLDDSVALSGVRLGRTRGGWFGLIRRYAFEFTVTGEQRLRGQISMFGAHLGRIELEPHPVLEPQPEPVSVQHPGNVIRLEDWRRKAQ